MEVLTTVAEMQQLSRSVVANGGTVGCVPTMGALHSGHASLIARSARAHTATIASIFVNPTQFGPTEDFSTYPRTLERDIQMVAEHGGTHIFVPSVAEMYPSGFSTEISVGPIADILEGASRPGHFAGVATVVCKLLNAMLPTEAFFGQKDFQQTVVLKKMISDLLLPVTFTVMPTIREPDGLAMSSRNRYLTTEEREQAITIYSALLAGKELIRLEGSGVRTSAVETTMRQVLESVPEIRTEYAVCVDSTTLESKNFVNLDNGMVLLIAARLGTTRLIDNMVIGDA